MDCRDGRIAGVTVREGGGESTVVGDYYVAAVPVERMAPLVTQAMSDADPVLAGIATLAGDVRWMNGIQYYMAARVPIVAGHVTYIETPWALTSISQAQFWQRYDLAAYGDGTVRDILSVDISDWDTPGVHTTTKPAKMCSADEVAAEVWAQLKHAINRAGEEILSDDLVRGSYLDRDISRAGTVEAGDIRVDGMDVDAEPLLVNKAGRWNIRPTAHTGIPNLFLAADYIRTNTNLATMEAANEAARRAVNGILDASGSTARECRVWPIYEPWILAPLRWYDARRYARGLPWDPRPPLPIRIAHGFVAGVGRLLIRLRSPLRRR